MSVTSSIGWACSCSFASLCLLCFLPTAKYSQRQYLCTTCPDWLFATGQIVWNQYLISSMFWFWLFTNVDHIILRCWSSKWLQTAILSCWLLAGSIAGGSLFYSFSWMTNIETASPATRSSRNTCSCWDYWRGKTLKLLFCTFWFGSTFAQSCQFQRSVLNII